MRKRNLLICFLLPTVLVTMNSWNAFAATPSEVSAENIQSEYLLEFEENSTMETLKTFENNLPDLSEITQVVFCVEQNNKTWSIGYCPAEGKYSMDDLKENVLYEIDYLNSKEIDGENYNIYLSDL